MSNARIIAATEAQNMAALPARSAWVSANAGSGKTRVLTNRVARLLLHGTPPGRILCLTFTKAAAAEMQNRLFRQLGAWAMMPDTRLRAALEALGEVNLPETRLAHARSLFARALETPGGLKIQTIHAFCESLLHRFPLEARVAPDFELLDERAARVLREEVLEEIAQETPEIFADFLAQVGAPERFLPEIIARQELFDHPLDENAAAAALEAEPDITEEVLLARVMARLRDGEINALARAMIRSGGRDDGKTGAVLAALPNIPATEALDMLEGVFLTAKGEMRKTSRFPTNATKDAFSGALDLVTILIERVYAARQSRLALATLARTRALHAFAGAFLHRYQGHKTARAVLEFDDLIRRANALLRQSDMAQWVLYRLDGGIDHILVDEAQDTSPRQWDIVKALAEEIYATAGEDPRTVFVVGDDKQSIFSFQGADPQEFAAVRELLRQRLKAVGRPMHEGELLCSFRSAPPILALVDKVFADTPPGGVSDQVAHISADESLPGRVELWPFYEAPEKQEQKPWDAPIDSPAPGDPNHQLARDIAARVADIIASKQVLPGKTRPVQAGDFLILVQARGALFQALLKELKAAGVPVAGADRLEVAKELAVKDLLALLRFAANPQDDLALACALRSPLCGRSEAELFGLAHGRKGSLWQAVQPDAMLSDILERVDYIRPFELLQRILIRHKGREKLLARLGKEAEEGVDELLRQALEYERLEAPGLTGFLDWLQADDLEVKRQFDNENNLLRIMSVHGAKGLEAPIVILPQMVKKPKSESPAILELPGGLAICGGNAQSLPALAAQESQRQNTLRAQEKSRLLYVALTRAENWLIMAGAGARKNHSGNWYDPVLAAMQALGARPDADGGLVLQHNWAPKTGTAAPEGAARPALPGWLSTPAPKRQKPPQPLSPSALGGGHSLSGTDADSEALLRGAQIHTLLEHLPATPPEARAAAAAKLLPAPLPGVVEEALKVLQTPALAPVFAPETLREVAISATIPGLGPIFGRIDALLPGDPILAVDFKSNPLVPATPEQVPQGFLRQMAAYRAALAQIYPGREISTAILWTASQSLMPLPPRLCDAALTALDENAQAT